MAMGTHINSLVRSAGEQFQGQIEQAKQTVPLPKLSPRTKITSLAQLRKGDHVMEEHPIGYWHHFIVEKVRSNFAWIIHKTGDLETGKRSFGASDVTIKAEVIKEKFFLRKAQVLYRIEYPEGDTVDGRNGDQMVVFSSDESVRRARKRLGEKDYNVFTSNCEHFCRECKTGKRESYQIFDFFLSLGRVVIFIFHAIFSAIVVAVATSTGYFAQATILMVGFVLGLALGGLQLAIIIIVEIVTVHRALSLGHVTPEDAERIKARRLTPIVLGFVGTVGGSFLGLYHIPVPILGTLTGAVLGNYFAQALGLLFGRWVATLLK